MPRTARSAVGGLLYHVLNRGNAGAKVFHKPGDYEAFIRLLQDANKRVAMRILSYCLMPNHFHFVVWPRQDEDLSNWMHWLITSHVRRYHRHYDSFGHVWQGRFKAFPIEDDDHYFTVVRYVERNPLRANLVACAESWRWSSLWLRNNLRDSTLLDSGPLVLPSDWNLWVNEPQSEAELHALRNCVVRGAPFGNPNWVKSTAQHLGLESTLSRRGRPSIAKRGHATF